MGSTFDRAVAEILRQEGGYVNDPKDPGGETKFGISKRAYPSLDIANLTEADALAIYRRDYWLPIRGDELPADVALLVFDAAVNQGPPAAVRLLQLAAGVTADGVMGPQTIRAAGRPGVALDLAVLRAQRYASTQGFERFGKGWLRRLFTVYQTATGEV